MLNDLGHPSGRENGARTAGDKTTVSESSLQVHLARLSERMRELADEVNPVLRDVSGNPEKLQVEVKSDGSVVTQWDRKMEGLIEKIVLESLPPSPVTEFLGEEGEELSPKPLERFASVELIPVCDPIDGTKRFIRGDDGYSSALGIYQATEKGLAPVFGSIHLPKENVLIMSEGDDAVEYDLSTGERLTLSRPDPVREGDEIYLAVGDSKRHYLSDSVGKDDLVTILNRDASIPNMVALLRGEIDGAIIRGCFWDVAAPLAIGEKHGFRAYSLKDGSLKEGFDFADFSTEVPHNRFRLREPLFVCHENDIDRMRPLLANIN